MAVVVITGASAGVGRATARAFARNGATLGVLARGADGLAEVRAEVEGEGARCLAMRTDVASADEVEQAATALEAELGPIDVWVNNAICSVFSPATQLEPAEIQRVTSRDLPRLGPRHAGRAPPDDAS